MFCILSFFVLAAIGVFNASYRDLAKEAYQCAFRRITFRACNTSFKDRMKATLTAKLLMRSPKVAKIFQKHFELFSWILVILTVVSTFWVAKGAYNFYLYGSCNGLNSSGFCALDPTGENSKVSQIGGGCTTGEGDESLVTLSSVDLSLFPQRGKDNTDTVVLIGCYSCDYTRKAYPLIKRLVSENPVRYVFAHYPVKEESTYILPYGYCAYKTDPDKFWTLNDRLFESSKDDISKPEYLNYLLSEVGYDTSKITACVNASETKTAVLKQRIELEKTNIYGTPLVFINGKGFVGPKPYRVYDRILNGIF